MKIGKKLKKSLVLFSLTLLGITSFGVPILSTSNIVNAEETTSSSDSNSDSKKTTSGKGNIGASSSAAVKTIFTNKSTYDFATQYAVTYNYLQGTFLSSDSYSNLYVGQEKADAFKVGVWSGVSGVPTIGQSMTITNNSIKEADTSLSDSEKSQAEAESESGKLAVELARAMADSTYSTVAENFKGSVDVSRKGFLNFKQYLVSGLNGKVNGSAPSKTSVAGKTLLNVLTQYYYNIIQGRINQYNLKGNPKEEDIINQLTENINNKISYDNIGSLFTKTQGNSTSTSIVKVDSSMPSYGDDYTNRSSLDVNKGTYVNYLFNNSSGINSEVSNKIIKSKEVSIVFGSRVSYLSIGTGVFNSYFSSDLDSGTKAFISDLYRFQNYTGTSSNTKKYFKNNMKSAIAKVLKKENATKFASNLISSSTKLEKSGKLIVYTPLEAHSNNTVQYLDASAYDKLLKKQDDSLADTSDDSDFAEIQDVNGSKRALQIRDLILSSTTSNSSKLLVGTNNSNRGYIVLSVGGSEKLKSKKSLRQYLGIYYGTSEDSKLKELVANDFTSLNIKLGSSTGLNGSNAMYKAISISKQYSSMNFGDETTASSSIIALAVDNYGNIIASETGDIVIPYWQNGLFLTGVSDSGISANVAMKDNIENINKLVTGNSDLYHLSEVKKKAIANLGNPEVKKYFSNTNKIKANIKSFVNSDTELLNKMKAVNGASMSNEDYSTLAMIISLSTIDDVNSFNKSYIKSIQDDGISFYAYPTQTEYLNQESYDKNKLSRWTAASLIQKIGFLIDYGIFDTIRLTNASGASNIYDGIVTWVGNIFYTGNITQTESWSSIIYALAGALLGFMIVYIGYLVLQIFRGIIRFKDVVIKVTVLTLVLIIPFTGYNLFTNSIINTPADKVLKSAVKQNLVVNFLEDRQANNSQGDDDLQTAYNELFGTYTGNREYSTKNFILKFYTTTNKSGVDVTNKSALSESEKLTDTTTLNTITNQYSKRKLVSVQASIFDLYVWSTEQVYARNNIPTSDGTNPTNQTFFEYLQNKYPDEYKDISNYREYPINTSALYTKEQKATGVYKDKTGKSITASELFYTLQYNSLKNKTGATNEATALSDGLKSLTSLVNIFNIDYKYTASEGVYIPSSSDYETLIRDLSMDATSRKQAYGSSNTNNFSDFTLAVFGKGNSTKYTLPVNASSYIPRQDYFGVYYTVLDLMSAQNGNYTNTQYTNVTNATYKIDSKTLSTIAEKYSNLESILNASYNNVDTNSALQMSVLLELYFNLNSELGFDNFPTDYEPESISMDSYLKMIYIPLSLYNFQSYKVSDMTVTNLMEYATLNENLLVILLLFITILMLLVFWMFYLFVFQILMMIVMVYKFIKEYVILNNYGNKSWQGVLYIYGTLGLVKLGLAVIWWICYTILNSAYYSYGGFTYAVMGTHSIAIIAYLIFASKFAIIPLISSIMEDKENLGATSFSQKIETARQKLSLGNIKGKLTGMPKSTAGRAMNKMKTLRNASPRNLFNKIARSKTGRFATKLDRATRKDSALSKDIREKLKAGTEKGLRTTKFGSKVADKIYKNEAKELTKQEKLLNKSNKENNLVKKFNMYTLKRAENSLQRNRWDKNVSVGDILNTANQANKLGTTILSMSNVPQTVLANHGEELVSYLSDNLGIASKITTNSKGEKILNIDSTSYDLSSEADRLALTTGMSTFVKSKKLEMDRNIVQGKVGELEGINTTLPMYSLNKEDNSIILDSTLKNGIDSNTIKQIFIDKNISASTKQEQKLVDNINQEYSFEPVTWKDSSGKLHVNQDKYKLVNKLGNEIEANEAEQIMANLAQIDNSTRERFNRQTFNSEDKKELNYKMVDFNQREQKEILDFIQQTNGVSLVDGNKIVYDSKNAVASTAVNKFFKKFKATNKETKHELTDFDNDLSAFAIHGQGNGTIKTNVLNSNENSREINSMFGAGYASNNNYTVALDGRNTEDSKALADSLVISSATSKLAEDKTFMQAIQNKDENRYELKKGLNQTFNNNPELIGKTLNYMEKSDTTLATSNIGNSLRTNYNNLVKDYKEGNITREKFEAQIPELTNQAITMLESGSMLEGFTNSINLDNYDTSIRPKNKEEIKQTLSNTFNNQPKMIGETLNYLKNSDSSVAQSSQFNKISSDYSNLLQGYKEGTISSTNFKNQLSSLSNEAVSMVESTGMLNGVSNEFKLNNSNKAKSKTELKQELNSTFTSQPNLIGDTLNYLQQTDSNISSSSQFNKIKDSYSTLVNDYKNGSISTESYNNQLQSLSNSAVSLLDSSDMIQNVASEFNLTNSNKAFNESNKKQLVNKIIQDKEIIKDKLKLSDTKDVDRHGINSEYVEKSTHIFGKNGDVLFNPKQNTMTIKTDNEIKSENNNLVNTMLGTDYNKLVNQKVSNDSPLVNQYMKSEKNGHKVKQTATQNSEFKQKDVKVSIDDLFNTDTSKQITKASKTIKAPEPVKNIEKEVKMKQDTVKSSINQMKDSMKTKVSQGQKIPKSVRDEYNSLIIEEEKIKKGLKNEFGLENDAQLIDSTNKLSILNEKILKFNSTNFK